MKIYRNEWDKLESLVNVHNHKEIKDKLIEEIVDTLQEKYFNRKKPVKQAIDTMCFLAKDKGYMFASPKYFKKTFNVGKDAIYSIVNDLIKYGLIEKANRSSSKQNGLGGMVIFFKSHPNFKAISSFLNFSQKAEQKPEPKAEIEPIPTESKDEGQENVSTYVLPITTELNAFKEETQLENIELDESFLPDYIPNEFTKMVKPYFSIADIDTLYSISAKTIHRYNKKLAVEESFNIIEKAFKVTLLQIQKKRVKKTFDDMKFYFSGVLKKLAQEVARINTVNSSTSKFYNWLES